MPSSACKNNQRRPTQLAHGCSGLLSADEPPCQFGLPEGVRRGGNADGVGLGNRFAQEVYQRVVDARVLDPSGREKKPHGCSFARGVGVVLPVASQLVVYEPVEVVSAAAVEREP